MPRSADLHDREASRALAAWYARHGRDLPWRRRPGPYEILVSEVMLQQTTVDAVIPYYRRFMERFPDVGALAAAGEEDLLRTWAGLGYYRRARNLHAAAREIAGRHGGVVPSAREELMALPGIGRYTAAAILSIAHGRPEVALDGNLKRVLGRYAGYEGSPETASGARELERIGAGLLEGADPAVINQALMDLGASHCSVKEPRCLLCPLEEHCVALRRGTIGKIPPPRRRPAPLEVVLAAGLVRKGRSLLMRRRGGRLMQGMWEFPMVEVSRRPAGGRVAGSTGAAGEAGAARALRRGIEAAGLSVRSVTAAGEVRHGITRHRIRVRIFEVAAGGSLGGTQAPLVREEEASRGRQADLAGTEGGELHWVDARQVRSRALTGIASKIADRLEAGAGAGGNRAAAEIRRAGSGRPSSARSGSSGRRDRPR